MVVVAGNLRQVKSLSSIDILSDLALTLTMQSLDRQVALAFDFGHEATFLLRLLTFRFLII